MLKNGDENGDLKMSEIQSQWSNIWQAELSTHVHMSVAIHMFYF